MIAAVGDWAGLQSHSVSAWLFALASSAVTFCAQCGCGRDFEEIIEQRHAVDPDGTLSILNTDGMIRVYGGDGSEVSIQAIKKAYTSDRLKSIVGRKATRKSIAIETISPPKKSGLSLDDRSGTVEYIVTVPQSIRITKLDLVNGEVLVEGLRGGSATAHLVNGWLAAHNCFGDLTFTIENGRLDVVGDCGRTQISPSTVELSWKHPPPYSERRVGWHHRARPALVES